MIKTKLTLTLLTAFLMMFAVAMVSGAGLQFSAVTGDDQNVNPGSQIPVTFKLYNDGDDYDISNIVLTFPDLFGEVGSWTSVSTTGLTISEGDYSSVLTTTLTIPNDQVAGTYSGDFGGTCRYSTSPETSRDINPYTYTITINSQPSLEASEPTTLTPSQSSTFTIENTGNTVLTPAVDVETLIYDSETLEFTVAGTGVLQPGDSQTITITSEVPGGEEALLAGQFTPITISAAGIEEDITKTLKIEGSYCEVGNIGDLNIKKIKFENNGQGKKDEWYFFDEIEVKLTIENKLDEKIKDVVVEWGLYNKDDGEFIFEEEESDFDLDEKGDDDDEKELTLKFTVDPDDFDSFDDIAFIIKAYSDDDGEGVHCISQIEEDIEIKEEEDFMLVHNINFDSDSVPCNQFLEGDFKVWNIGSEDQEDDLYVMVMIPELEVEEKIEIGSFDSLEDKKFPFSVKIPADAVERQYAFNIKVYEEDGDPFENGEDDNEAIFDSQTPPVEGNCIGAEADVEITAILDPETPEAVPGKQIIVKATLRNMGDAEATYTVSVEGNSAWSNLVAVDPQVVTIPAGESQDVNLILSVNSDAEGSKEFTIKATSDGRTKTQPFGVTVTTTDDQAVEVADHIRENWFIYLIIIVNIILIIAIIIVIRRMVAPAPM